MSIIYNGLTSGRVGGNEPWANGSQQLPSVGDEARSDSPSGVKEADLPYKESEISN